MSVSQRWLRLAAQHQRSNRKWLPCSFIVFPTSACSTASASSTSEQPMAFESEHNEHAHAHELHPDNSLASSIFLNDNKKPNRRKHSHADVDQKQAWIKTLQQISADVGIALTQSGNTRSVCRKWLLPSVGDNVQNSRTFIAIHKACVAEKLGQNNLSGVVRFLSTDMLCAALLSKPENQDRLSSSQENNRETSMPILCLFDNALGHDLSCPKTTIQTKMGKAGDMLLLLDGVKYCLSDEPHSSKAKQCLVLARSLHSETNKRDNACLDLYLIDTNEHANEIEFKNEREVDSADTEHPDQLTASQLTRVHFTNLSLFESNRLGVPGSAYQTVVNSLSSHLYLFGASVVGCMRRVIDALTSNERALVLSAGAATEANVQCLKMDRLSQLTLMTYALESIVYEVAATDGLTADNKIDNLIVFKSATNVLQFGTMTVTMTFGLSRPEFMRQLLDSSAVSGWMLDQDTVNKWIAMSGLTAFARVNAEKLVAARNVYHMPAEHMKVHKWINQTIGRDSFGPIKPRIWRRRRKSLLAPNFHEQLQKQVTEIEQCQNHFEAVQCRILGQFGREIEDHPRLLHRVADIVSDLFVAHTVCARATQSRALKQDAQSEMELQWAACIADAATARARRHINALLDIERISYQNDQLREKVAVFVSSHGGYAIETPINRMW